MEESDVLFQVKKEHLETGLRGIPVGYCVTSAVHPENGLFYAEKPISSLAEKQPEEVIYLLLYGKDPSEGELKKFQKELQSRAVLSEKVIQHIKALPKEGYPMTLFSAALLVLSAFECRDDYEEDCLNLIAKMPHLTALFINHHAGWGETPACKPEMGYIENFAQMLKVPHPVSPNLPEVLKLFNILHYDHGGGNLSTFVGKCVASGLADLYVSIASAMNALAGPRHGRANQECLNFVHEIMEKAKDNFTQERIEEIIREKLAKKELIFGFGHAVLRVEDSRATILFNYCEKFYKDHPLVQMAFLIRKAGVKVLKENPKITNPYPNVDAISGILLTAAGFDFPEYYTVLFGLSRAVGIAIQIVYERCIAREGKGTPIIRPKYIYKPRYTQATIN